MSMELATLFGGVRTAEGLLDKVLSKRGTRIQSKIDAVTLMQRAINRTASHLARSGDDYSPNDELSELWLAAFTAMIKVDKQLAGRLRDKSRFWSNPQEWLWESGSMELVPTLNELNEKCDMLLVELENRG